jgi:hypothetical protein
MLITQEFRDGALYVYALISANYYYLRSKISFLKKFKNGGSSL